MKKLILPKKLLFIPIALLGLSASANSFPNLLVDDFEDYSNPGQTKLGGKWFAYDDNAAGGESTYDIPTDADGNLLPSSEPDGSFMKMIFELKQGTLTTDPYVGIGFNMTATEGEAMNLTNYSSISYKYKGPDHVVIIRQSNSDTFQSVKMEGSVSWKTITLDWEQFTQSGTQEPNPLNPALISSVSWQVQEPTPASGDVFLDDISFVRILPYIDITSPAQNATINTNEIDIEFVVNYFTLGTDGKIKYTAGTVSDYTESNSPINIKGLSAGKNTVTLELVSMNNASFSPAIENSVDFTVTGTGLDTSFADQIKIYPNPATDFVNVEFAEEVDNLSLINSNGQILVDLKPATVQQINVKNLPSGIYFIKITKGSASETFKIAIK